jgi:uncharacterized protein (TIGR02266 family)
MDERSAASPLIHFRARPRVRTEVAVRLRSEAPGLRDLAARTRDLGPGGAFVLCGTPVTLGCRLQLRIETPDEEPAIEVQAEVVWCSPPGAAEPGLGVRFVDPPAAALRRIGALADQGDLPVLDLYEH